MNGILPRLTRKFVALSLLGTLATATCWGDSPETATSPVAEHSPGNQDATAGGSSGNRLVQAARTALLARESVAARVRYRVRMYDSDLAGSGIYLQLGRDDARRFRWELRMQVAGTTSALVQVSDGRFLWTDRSLPSGPTVTRIDLRRIREALGAKSPTNPRRPPDAAFPMLATDLLHGGGLPRLLASLDERYTFGPLQQSDLQDVPMYVVEGTRSSERKTGNRKRDGVRYMPRRVRLTLGRDDLFPYQLSYSAVSDITDEGEPIKAESGNGSALVIEWYDVQLNGPIDARQFHYSPPAESNWKDVTEELLSSPVVQRQ